MQFGATVWTFHWHHPYNDAIRRIARLGFQSVELIAWNPDVLSEYYTKQRIRQLRSLLTDSGITLNEFVATPPGMASPDHEKRRAAVEYTKRVIDVARELGTRTINHVAPTPFGLPFPPLKSLTVSQEWTVEIPDSAGRQGNWDDNWRGYVEVVQGIADLLEPAGMRLAIEPHPYRWVSSAASFMRLADAVGSETIGLNFDPSHLFPSGDMPQVAVYTVGRRIYNTHFSDNDGVTNAHWRPGRGKIDWRAVMQALHDIGYDGTISIELEDVPGVSTANQASTRALDEEYLRSREYIREVSSGSGIQWVTEAGA